MWAAVSCTEPTYSAPDDGSSNVRKRDAAPSGALASDASSAAQGGELDARPSSHAEPTADADVEGPGQHPSNPGSEAPDAAGPIRISDASAPTTTALPLWAMPLLGQYAVRAFVFKRDDITVTRAEQRSLVEFVAVGGGMQLRTTLCLFQSDNGVAQLMVLDPSHAPQRVEDVVFSEEDKRWGTTSSESFYLGYTAAPPSICDGKLGGSSVPHLPSQAWLSSTNCVCGLRNDPPTMDDCRVVDPDNDKKPGITFSFESSIPRSSYKLYYGMRSDSRYVNGVVGADGSVHTANLMSVENNYQFGCDPTDCADISKLGEICPPFFNPVRFKLLNPAAAPTAGYSCADVNSASLFPEAPPGLNDCKK